MKDFNEYVKLDTEQIEYSVLTLNEFGDSDATINYLYFMRDEINKQIKKVNAAKKVR